MLGKDRPERIRREYQRAARLFDMDFHDYDPAEARVILGRTLAEEPCPVEADQIVDVRDHFELLRRRTALLPGGAVNTPQQPDGHAAGRPSVHKLKITLRGSKPPIWRRLEVPSDNTLEELDLCDRQEQGMSYVPVLAKDPPLRLWAILDEAALHREVGGTEVMRGRLQHLSQIARRPEITLRVIPYGVGAHVAMAGAVSI